VREPGILDILAQRYRGSRYSFGYPACPNIQDQAAGVTGSDRINLHMDERNSSIPNSLRLRSLPITQLRNTSVLNSKRERIPS